MKRKINVLLFLGIFVLISSCGYNDMVTMREYTKSQWANVESSYQRRADLIPNLVVTVKGYTSHEKETLTDVINARAKATSINIDVSKLTASDISKFQEAQNGLTGALNKLMMISEKYPNLKANDQFIALQAQLEGTENRINVERNRFNKSVMDYNAMIVKFPKNLTAKIFNFEKIEYFKSEISASKAPEVKF